MAGTVLGLNILSWAEYRRNLCGNVQLRNVPRPQDVLHFKRLGCTAACIESLAIMSYLTALAGFASLLHFVLVLQHCPSIRLFACLFALTSHALFAMP
jgi:hypothetical protein